MWVTLEIQVCFVRSSVLTSTLILVSSMFDFQFYTLHGLLLDAEHRGLTSFLRDENGSEFAL